MVIHIEDKDGRKESLTLAPNANTSLMEVLVEHSFKVDAICGGMAGCGTCHIEVRSGIEKLDKMEEDEEFMLEGLPNMGNNSRLSCQVPLTEELDQADIKVLGDGA